MSRAPWTRRVIRDRSVRAWPALLSLVLAALMTGCGGSTPPPVEDGRSAFSYDDDEIDPEALQPQGDRAKAPGRR